MSAAGRIRPSVPDLLIKPLKLYNREIWSTFDPLPEVRSKKVKEVILRVVVVACAIIIYPIAIPLAIIGLSLKGAGKLVPTTTFAERAALRKVKKVRFEEATAAVANSSQKVKNNVQKAIFDKQLSLNVDDAIATADKIQGDHYLRNELLAQVADLSISNNKLDKAKEILVKLKTIEESLQSRVLNIKLLYLEKDYVKAVAELDLLGKEIDANKNVDRKFKTFQQNTYKEIFPIIVKSNDINDLKFAKEMVLKIDTVSILSQTFVYKLVDNNHLDLAEEVADQLAQVKFGQHSRKISYVYIMRQHEQNNNAEKVAAIKVKIDNLTEKA